MAGNKSLCVLPSHQTGPGKEENRPSLTLRHVWLCVVIYQNNDRKKPSSLFWGTDLSLDLSGSVTPKDIAYLAMEHNYGK